MDVNIKQPQDIKVNIYYKIFIGIFMDGFLNGYGLKFNAGKYSFGRF